MGLASADRRGLFDDAAARQAACQAEALGYLADLARDSGDDELAEGYLKLRELGRWPMRRAVFRRGEPVRTYWYWQQQGYEEFADSYHLPRGCTWPDVGTPPVNLRRMEEDFGAVLEAGARAVGRWLRTGGG